MTVDELRKKVERRKKWLGDSSTMIARNKLFLGEALTVAESKKLFEYLRKLEIALDKVIDM